jgi:hypothetical protein
MLMPRPPISVYSANGSAEQVRNLLLTLAPDAEVEAEDDDWSAIVLSFPEGSVRVLHNRDYYAGPDWPRQKSGMQGYFDRFPLGDRRDQLTATIGSFQFALTAWFDPDYHSFDDKRVKAVCHLAEVLDGVLYTPGALRDPQGRVLVSADGEVDEDACWPLAGRLFKSEADQST